MTNTNTNTALVVPGALTHGRAHERNRMARQRELTEWYLRGYRSIDALTAKMHEVGYTIARRTIARDLVSLARAWREEPKDQYATAQSRQLQELDEVRKAAWAQWYHSLKDGEQTRMRRDLTAEEAVDPERAAKARPVLLETWRRGRLGPSQYLYVILECNKEERKMLGTDAPQKHEVTHSIDWDKLYGEDTQGIKEITVAFEED